MVNMTLSISDDLMEKMKKFKEIKWSVVARQAISERVRDLEVMGEIASKSKLSDKDVKEIGKRIKSAVSSRFNEADY